MAETGSRRGAASTTSLILATVAVVAIGGLIYWLNVTAEPTQVELTPEDTASEEPVSDVPIVALEDLRAEIAEYENIEFEMRGQTVNSLLGDQGFWIGPQDNPFLVMMDSAMASSTDAVEPNDTLNVRGTLRTMADSILDRWEEEGVISGQGERAVASFAEYFMNASQVRPAAGGGQGGASGSGGQGQDGGSAGASGDDSGGQ